LQQCEGSIEILHQCRGTSLLQFCSGWYEASWLHYCNGVAEMMRCSLIPFACFRSMVQRCCIDANMNGSVNVVV
jgi:hypothetical protein